MLRNDILKSILYILLGSFIIALIYSFYLVKPLDVNLSSSSGVIDINISNNSSIEYNNIRIYVNNEAIGSEFSLSPNSSYSEKYYAKSLDNVVSARNYWNSSSKSIKLNSLGSSTAPQIKYSVIKPVMILNKSSELRLRVCSDKYVNLIINTQSSSKIEYDSTQKNLTVEENSCEIAIYNVVPKSAGYIDDSFSVSGPDYGESVSYNIEVRE